MSSTANFTPAPNGEPLPLPPIYTEYLVERGFTPADCATLASLGVRSIAQHDAEARIGVSANFLGGWSEYIWHPGREPDGSIHPTYGHLIQLRKASGFLGSEIQRERKCPSARVSPQRAVFFGSGWHGYEGEFAIHESYLKAALWHLHTGQLCIALNGIDGYSANDHIVDHLYESPWSKKATALVVYDHPNRTSPKSAEGVADAKQRLVHTIGASLAAIYDGPVPAPIGSAIKQGFDDFYAKVGDQAIAHIRRHKRLLSQPTNTDFLLTSAVDIMQREPSLWIVKNLIPSGDSINIVGATSCGKTFFAMDAMLAIARDDVTHWMGQRVAQHGLVVHITLEGTGLPYRLRAYRDHHKLGSDALRRYRAIEVPVNLRDEATVERVIDRIRAVEADTGEHIRVICIDTVNRALSGADENSSVEMGALLRSADLLRTSFPSSTVMLVHHLGKVESAGARGHSSFTGNAGAELRVSSNEKGQRTVTVSKQREGRTDIRLHFELAVEVVGKDADGDEITSCVVKPIAAPVEEVIDIHAILYNWAGGKPISANLIKDSLTNGSLVAPKGATGNQIREWFKTAMGNGYATETNRPTGASTGKFYTIRRPPEVKY